MTVAPIFQNVFKLSQSRALARNANGLQVKCNTQANMTLLLENQFYLDQDKA